MKRRTAPVVPIKRCDPICASAGECCFERAYQIGRLDERNRRPYQPPTPKTIDDAPDLYRVTRDVMHAFGLPWTDPRTGRTHPPPRARTKKDPK